MLRSVPKDQVDSAEALMRDVGARLRRARIERGEELDTLAQHLRIRPAYLSSIEEGDLSTLPGRTYALGFLRSYADYLGFDGRDLVTQIKSAVGNLTRKQRLRIHTPMPENRLPRAPVLAISLVLIVGVYGAWSYVGGSDVPVVETVTEVPEELRELAVEALLPLPEPLRPDAPLILAEPGGGGGIDAFASSTQAGDVPETEDLEPGAGRAPDEPADAAAEALPAGTPPEGARAIVALPESSGGDEVEMWEAPRVVLRALGTSWVQVSSAAGDYRFVRTLEPGETFPVPDRPDLSLWTGNAGGLEILVDGRALPALGPEGRVVRDLPLDPDALIAHVQARAR